ncbi:alpha/beta fold hydrolase [Variovorax sp. GT1P44]|uniref:alpha/beta fold hydrolase n=1 Tax=Variovorax sp. GT1P44 TaxID=3443742 RepID=UPI003F456E87
MNSTTPRGNAAGTGTTRKPNRAAPVARKRAQMKPRARPSAQALTVPADPTQAADTKATVQETIDRLAEVASRSTLAINPLIGVRLADIGAAAQTLVGSAVRQPISAARHWGAYALELGKVATGRSTHAPEDNDKRFADPAWRSNAVLRRLVQAHAATSSELGRFIGDSKLDARDKARAQLVASMYVDSISPSNTLLHPGALKKAIDTGGASLARGVKNLVHDLRHNHGLPSSVDKSKFELGRNLGLSEGRVVFRNEVLELIQYAPRTSEVYARPLVICPPQVNKFYAMDLSPEKSLVQFAVKNGIQLFAVSWRNPTLEHRHWDMSTYVQALDEAVDAARQITGSPDISLWGACSGGMTAASYLGWLAATGQKKVANIVSPVCTLDPELTRDTAMGLLVSEQSLALLRANVKRKGYVDSAELARVFAWMRPNDLIWNYWVNNYLLGNDPPAFDILYWNADTTRLPAAFHSDLLDIMERSPFVNAGEMKVLGEPIDMRKVDVEAYVVAGITDHITPWKACYPTARIYGPKSTFTLANAGHLQSIINPPGQAKSFFLTGQVGGEDCDAWAAGAQRVDGSWWPHWMDWMHARSGGRVPAPKKLGSRVHRPGAAAPGDYVLEA